MEQPGVFEWCCNCIICRSNVNTWKLTNKVNKEEPEDAVITKLQFIAPEIEWSEQFCICERCVEDLLSACRFKERCLTSEYLRLKTEATDEDCSFPEIKHDYNDINNECDLVKFENNELDEEIKLSNPVEMFPTKRKNGCNRKEVCGKCGRKYASVSSLKTHELVCDGIVRHRDKSNAKFQCNKCNRYYTTNKIMKAHIKSCGLKMTDSIKQSTNSNCERNVVSDNQRELTLNRQSQPSKKCTRFRTFLCEVCQAKFFFLKDILEHCQTKHSMDTKTIKPYLCETCNARFRTSSNLKGHQRYHIGDRSNICTYCGKGFIKPDELFIHEKTHFPIRAFKCDICDKAFKSNANRRTHKLFVHTSPSKWKNVCNICEKRFPQKGTLDQHVRRHIGEKNFICHICNKGFTTKDELKKHEAHHSNIRPFKCEHCEMEYKQGGTYKVHLKRVHGIGNAKLRTVEKKFACHICPAKFGEKGKLARHLCVHSGLKPYACTSCDRKFSDKSYLNQHLKVRHNEVEDCS